MRIIVQLGGVQAGRAGHAGRTENLHHLVFRMFASPTGEYFIEFLCVLNAFFHVLKARIDQQFGFVDYDHVIHPGTNGKMVEVCAAMGLTNLQNVNAVIAANLKNYHAYC